MAIAAGLRTKAARALPAGLTAAAAAVVLGALAAASAVDAKACEYVPVHRILASAGGVYKMSDGRELKATKVDVGGCTTMGRLPTGLAYPNTNSNYTVVSHENDERCVTGTGRDGSMPTYKGFQGILVETNGFKFSADLVLEDIDAQVVSDPADGWRETMSSLGMADGAVVRPTMTTRRGSLVAVQQFRVPAESLTEVGFPGKDLLIDGAAYKSWTETKSRWSAWASGDAEGRRWRGARDGFRGDWVEEGGRLRATSAADSRGRLRRSFLTCFHTHWLLPRYSLVWYSSAPPSPRTTRLPLYERHGRPVQGVCLLPRPD